MLEILQHVHSKNSALSLAPHTLIIYSLYGNCANPAAGFLGLLIVWKSR